MADKYCKDCLRWYSTGDNQCNIPNPGFKPNCGVAEEDREKFIKAVGKSYPINTINKKDIKSAQFITHHMEFIQFGIHNLDYIYGKPSQLNKDNDCIFYKALPKCISWLTPFIKMFY